MRPEPLPIRRPANETQLEPIFPPPKMLAGPFRPSWKKPPAGSPNWKSKTALPNRWTLPNLLNLLNRSNPEPENPKNESPRPKKSRAFLLRQQSKQPAPMGLRPTAQGLESPPGQTPPSRNLPQRG